MGYTVQPGDSWASIAGKVYGNQRWYEQLAAANAGVGMLTPGMTISTPNFDTDQDPLVQYDPESLNVPATDMQGNQVTLMGLNPFNRTANQILRDYWGGGGVGAVSDAGEAAPAPTGATGPSQAFQELASTPGLMEQRLGLGYDQPQAPAPVAPPALGETDVQSLKDARLEPAAPLTGVRPERSMLGGQEPERTVGSMLGAGASGQAVGNVVMPSGGSVLQAPARDVLNLGQYIEDELVKKYGGKLAGIGANIAGWSAEQLTALTDALGFTSEGGGFQRGIDPISANEARQATPVEEAMGGQRQVTGIPGFGEPPDLAEAGGLALAEDQPYLDNASLWFDSMPTYGPDSNIQGPVAQSYAELYLGDRQMWASWYPSADGSAQMAKILEGINSETWDMGPYAAVHAMREYITRTGFFPSIMANLVKRGLGFSDEQMTDQLGYVQDPRGFWVQRQDDKVGGTGNINLSDYPNLIGGYYNRTFSRRGGYNGGGGGGSYSNYAPANSVNWRIGL